MTTDSAEVGLQYIIDRKQVIIPCAEYGQRQPTALLFHGLAGYAGEWRSTVRWLAATHRVLALDARLRPQQRVPGDVTRGAYLADAIAVIE